MNTDVINILSRSTCTGLLLTLPNEQLDRKLYTAVNKILVDLGGKWNRAKKAHIFTSDPSDIIDEICLTGEYTSRKKELQFFETPKILAARLVELADIKKGDCVLEPSAGHGRIAELLDNPWCIEIDRHNVEVLRGKGIGVLHFDFLKDKALAGNFEIDVVVANPPFTRQQDIDHVTKMIKVAKRKVVSIMSASILYRDNKKTLDFKALLNEFDHEIIELDPGTFSESGTNVKAVIVVIDK